MTTRGPPESALQGIPGGVPSVTLPQTHTWWLESKAYVLVIHINENYNNVYLTHSNVLLGYICLLGSCCHTCQWLYVYVSH